MHLVIGASGQVGGALIKALQAKAANSLNGAAPIAKICLRAQMTSVITNSI